MKNWYFYNAVVSKDIFHENNYSKEVLEENLPMENHKLYSILANDNGDGRPIIDRDQLTSDFIYAANHKMNFGIVRLHKKFIRRENWLNIFISWLVKFI